MIDMVPKLTENPLVSMGRFVDANYITIFNDKEVNIYDAITPEIVVSRKSIMKGCRDKKAGYVEYYWWM